MPTAELVEAPQPVVAAAADSPPLRRLLVTVDSVALALGWAAVVMTTAAGQPSAGLIGSALQGAVVVPVGLLLLSASGLYRRSICANRAAEVSRIIRATVVLNLISAVLLGSYGFELAATAGLVGGLVWTVLLVLERGAFREWIQLRRAGGDFGAPVLVVGGTTGATERTADFLTDNPFLGFSVRGVLPYRTDDGEPTGAMHASAVEREAALAGASGVVLDAGSLTGDELNDAVRELSGYGLHVHISSGVRGIDGRRITVSPIADETFLHVAPPSLDRRQRIVKRGMDFVVGSSLLVLASPLLLLAAVAIRCDGPGPILFRQRRVGLGGEPFTIFKFRTMTVDADERLAALRDGNHRDGPLFKLSADPRVTRIGRLLRASSIDELPQLLNVLEGTMSLVGPRPALPVEVAQFDAELRARLNVKPGLTGLWQVEARDLPSFDLYRRYDLLYVENWSVLGDLSLLLRTAWVVAMRGARAVLPAGARPEGSVLE